MFKVLGSCFVTLSILVLSGAHVSFAPLKIPKTDRFPGHDVLQSYLFRKIKQLIVSKSIHSVF